MSVNHKIVIITVFALILGAHATAPGWTTCGNLPDDIANTACPLARSTCAQQSWMPSDGSWGCCPYPNGVSCGNYTCCPASTTCENAGSGFSVTSTCVANDGTKAFPGTASGGKQVCKSGGPLPLSTTLKNVIVLGDSVSIGYTPHVAAHLAGIALVQHSPWGGDGGAEETAFGFECLEFLLAAPDGTPQAPAADVLFWNFGLHNLNNNTDPGQSGPIAEYAPFLDKIAQKLVTLPSVISGATKLVFGITTPMMCSAESDAIVQSNNIAAVAIMAKHGVPTVDMHAPIVAECGPAPNNTCFGQKTCFCPHCSQANGVGYEYLASNIIVPAIHKLLLVPPLMQAQTPPSNTTLVRSGDTTLRAVRAAASAPDYEAWDRATKRNVHINGTQHAVDYWAMKTDVDFVSFVKSLETADTASLTKNETYALYMNAYNALAMKMVIDHACKRNILGHCEGPIISITDIGIKISGAASTVWLKEAGIIGGKKFSLQAIEDYLRTPTPFAEDARLHSCIVCASKSCPNVRIGAFFPSTVESQMTSNFEAMVSNTHKGMSINRDTSTVTLSKIFSWYARDFQKASPGSGATVLGFISQFVTDAADKAFLKTHGNATLAYFDYDWSANGVVPCSCASRSSAE